MGWWVGGGPGHYVVTPTQVEVELRLRWAVTIIIGLESILVFMEIYLVKLGI